MSAVLIRTSSSSSTNNAVPKAGRPVVSPTDGPCSSAMTELMENQRSTTVPSPRRLRQPAIKLTPADKNTRRYALATWSAAPALPRSPALPMSAFRGGRPAAASLRRTSWFCDPLRYSGASCKRSPRRRQDWPRSGHQIFSDNIRVRKRIRPLTGRPDLKNVRPCSGNQRSGAVFPVFPAPAKLRGGPFRAATRGETQHNPLFQELTLTEMVIAGCIPSPGAYS